MTKPTGKKLLESVVKITNERDKSTLEKVLISTIDDFISVNFITILSVPRVADEPLLTLDSACPENKIDEYLQRRSSKWNKDLVVASDLFLRCMETHQIIDVDDGENKVVVPIFLRDEIVNLLYVCSDNLGDSDLNFIEGFVTIYSNFVSVIDDNEHDTLTGLLNRKTFDKRISSILSNYATEQSDEDPEERRKANDNVSHWLGILDIDFFKRINDDYGHLYGDEVLLLFSKIMSECFRSNDILFRYGGEEFVVVLSPSTEIDALKTFERFRQTIEQYDFPQIGQVTVSIGVVDIRPNQYPTTVIDRADVSLYYAKDHGRNQVQSYRHLVEKGAIEGKAKGDDVELF